MKKILLILIIFLFAVISTILIYNKFDKKSLDILSIGDSLSLGKNNYGEMGKGYNYYLNTYYRDSITISYDDLSYERLFNMIYYDENIYYKGKYINIKYAINNSDIIILNANNDLTFKKCNKNDRIIEEYLNNIFDKIANIVDIINNVKKTNIIVISPYCLNPNNVISDYIDKYYVYENIKFINAHKGLHTKLNYLPGNRSYPSYEGHYFIYSEILKNINSFM